MARIFAGAFLFFTLQPLVGKSLLPSFGGAASIWVFCLMFFQLALVGGYLWAHWMHRFQVFWHGLALLGAVGVAHAWTEFHSSLQQSTTAAVLLQLAPLLPVSILLTATTPLIQKTTLAPYRIFAVSNLGCLLALILYVVVFEPFVDLSHQWLLWKLAAIGLGSSFVLMRKSTPESASSPPLFLRKVWLLESGVPCALLAATTSQLSLRLTAMPLVWVIPLGCYLMSWVLAFARPAPYWVIRVWPTATIIGVLTYIVGERFSPAWMASLQVVCLFLVSWGLHAQIYRSRPKLNALTSFYLNLALGGMIGTLLVAVAAPLVFNAYLEFPLLLCAARLLYRPGQEHDTRPSLNKRPIRLGLETTLLSGFYGGVYLISTFSVIWPTILACGLAALLLRRPARIALGILCVAQIFVSNAHHRNLLHSSRSFYGPLTVQREGPLHVLTNGQTVHGRQNLEEGQRHEALGYYNRDGGAGQLFLEHGAAWRDILGIGLGTGALAAYLQADQHMVFFEIDPQVVDLAENPELFTYLGDARQRGASITNRVGDARQLLREHSKRFDAIFVDAFYGSAIPMHLLTREAFQLYLARLNPDGFLAFHTSHPLLDFPKFLKQHARAFHLSYQLVDSKAASDGKDPSSWVILRKGASTPAPSDILSAGDERVSPLHLLRYW